MATKEMTTTLEPEILISNVARSIYTLRGYQVMIDNDLAQIYEVTTKNLKKAVRRNIERFPTDFMFEPSESELQLLRFQIGTSKCSVSNIGREPFLCEISDLKSEKESDEKVLRFQSGTSKVEIENRGGSRYTPFVFTEPGIAMLSSVLHSDRAIQTNISIMRVFIQLRMRFMTNPSEMTPQFDSLKEELATLKDRFNQFERFSSESKSPNPKQRDYDKVKIIQEIVAGYWNLQSSDLTSASRTREISLARQVAIFFVRKHLGMTFVEIGRHFGSRDHSTILHAYRKIHVDSEDNERVRTVVAHLQTQLRPLLV